MKKLIILLFIIGILFINPIYAETIDINSDNYDTYFTNTGTQNINDGDTINFNQNLGYRFTTIDKNITVTSNENVVLTDVCFTLADTSSGSTIKNLNMKNSVYTFRIYADDISLTNNNIVLDNNQGIPITSMLIEDTNNVLLENNNIEAYGTSSTYNLLLRTNNNLQLIGNTIYLKTKESKVFWSDEMIGSYDSSNIEIRESENILLKDNKINTESFGYDSEYGTILNIHSLETENLNLINNQINTNGYQYAYSTVFDNSIIHLTDNNINTTATNYANSITIFNTTALLETNTLTSDANLSYPIYLVNTKDNILTNNNINSNGNYNYGIELYNSNNNTIKQNKIEINGKYTLGIGLAASSTNNLITMNNINTQGTLEDEIKCGDHIPCENVGIKLLENSENTTITNNTINSKGKYTINRQNNNPIITNNQLNSKDNTGILTIYPTEENIIITITTVENFTGYYMESKNLTGKLTDNQGNPIIGHHLSLNLTRLSSGANKEYQVTTDINGEFNFQINLAPGTYTAQAKYTGITINDKTYANSISDTSKLIITNNPNTTIINLEDYNQPYTENQWNKDLTGQLLQANGEKIIGRHINLNLTRLSSGASKTYDTTTDYNGEFTLKIMLAPGNYQVTANFNDEEYTPAYKTINMIITRT